MQEKQKEVSVTDLLVSIKFWAKILYRKWLIIVTTVLIGALIGVVYSLTQKRQYVANVNFVLYDEKGGGGIGGALGLASQFGFDLGVSGGGAFSESNLVELMKTRNLVEKALLSPIAVNGQNISLAEHYLQFSGTREKWKDNPALTSVVFLPSLDRSKFTRIQDSVLGSIYKKMTELITVGQKDKKISVFNLKVTSEDERFSKVFAETISAVVSDFYIETKSKKALLNVMVLEKQADSIRSQLNSAIGGVAAANDQTFNLNPALNINRIPSTRRQIDVQANTAILTQLVANLELARVNLRKETPLIQIIDKPILPLDVQILSKRKAAMAGAVLFFLVVVIYLFGKEFLKKLKEEKN